MWIVPSAPRLINRGAGMLSPAPIASHLGAPCSAAVAEPSGTAIRGITEEARPRRQSNGTAAQSQATACLISDDAPGFEVSSEYSLPYSHECLHQVTTLKNAYAKLENQARLRTATSLQAIDGSISTLS